MKALSTTCFRAVRTLASDSRKILPLPANVFFLQTITVPVYGSNSPLWSLANEFWYYLLFPLLLLAPQRGWLKGGLLFAVALAIRRFCPPKSSRGTHMADGAAAWWLAHRGAVRLTFEVALGVVVSSALSSRASAPAASTFGSAPTMLSAPRRCNSSTACRSMDGPERLPYSGPPSTMHPPCEALSEISYPCIWSTFHWHIHLVYVFGANSAPTRLYWSDDLVPVGSTLIYSYAIWWLFERHTPSLQRMAIAALNKWTRALFERSISKAAIIAQVCAPRS